jgi:hypothetical protein
MCLVEEMIAFQIVFSLSTRFKGHHVLFILECIYREVVAC